MDNCHHCSTAYTRGCEYTRTRAEPMQRDAHGSKAMQRDAMMRKAMPSNSSIMRPPQCFQSGVVEMLSIVAESRARIVRI